MPQAKRKLATIKVRDWMSRAVLAVESYDSIAVARQLMAKHRVNQLPVLDDDRLIGIVTDRDIRDAYPTSMMINRTKEIDQFAEKVTVEEVMTRDILIVHPETTMDIAVGLLRKHRIGSLPVIENDGLAGILTRSDILDFVLSGSAARRKAKPKAKKRSAKTRKKKQPVRES